MKFGSREFLDRARKWVKAITPDHSESQKNFKNRLTPQKIMLQ